MGMIVDGMELLRRQMFDRKTDRVSFELPQTVTRIEMLVYVTKPAAQYGSHGGLVLNDGVWWELTISDQEVVIVLFEKAQQGIGVMMGMLAAMSRVDMRRREMFVYSWHGCHTTVVGPRGGSELNGSLEEIREHVRTKHVGGFTEKPEVFD